MTPLTRRGFSSLAAAGLAVGAGRPAAAADSALAAAALKEGQLTWYTVLVVNQLSRPLADAFQKKYPGITVNYSRQAAEGTALKVSNELQAHQLQADVIDGSAALQTMVTSDRMDKFAGETATSLGFAKDTVTDDGCWAAEDFFFIAPAINTQTVSPAEIPHGYKDLLDPRWRGNMAWTDDPTVNGPPGFIGNILRSMGQQAGMSYLQQLAKQNIANVPADHRVVTNQVISGQYMIDLTAMNHLVDISVRQGAPVRWLNFDPVIQTMNYVGLLKDSPHPNAGKLFLSYVLSDEGQGLFKAAGYIPCNPRVDASNSALKPGPGKFTAQPITPEMAQAQMAEWTKIYNDLFK